jgi:hypothetical protein
MEAKADVGQLIFIVKERNRYLAALKEINSIAASIDDPNTAELEFNLISDLCKRAIASPRKVHAEVNKAVSLLPPR